MPKVLPRTGCCGSRDHWPARTSRSSRTTDRPIARSKANVVSATASWFVPGVIMTTTRCRVASSSTTASLPTPSRDTTRNWLAAVSTWSLYGSEPAMTADTPRSATMISASLSTRFLAGGYATSSPACRSMSTCRPGVSYRDVGTISTLGTNLPPSRGSHLPCTGPEYPADPQWLSTGDAGSRFPAEVRIGPARLRRPSSHLASLSLRLVFHVCQIIRSISGLTAGDHRARRGCDRLAASKANSFHFTFTTV